MTLEEIYYEKIVLANEIEGLYSFVFQYKDEYYLVEWVKGIKWSDPVKIKMI